MVAFPPRTKRRVSEIRCFITGPQGVAVRDDAVEVAPSTLAEPLCLVRISWIVLQVAYGLVEIFLLVPHILEGMDLSSVVPMLPQVLLLPGSSSSSHDSLSFQ